MPSLFIRKSSTASKPSLVDIIKERRAQRQTATSPPAFDDFVDCVPPPSYGPRRIVVRDQTEPDYAALHAKYLAASRKW